MKKVRKIIALVLTISLLSSVFVGCSQDKPSDTTKTEGSSTTDNHSQDLVNEKEISKEDFEGEISIALPSGDYIDFMKNEIVPYFQNEYPNVSVTLSDDQNVDTRIAAGDAPDIYAGVFGYQPAKYSKTGNLVNYEEFDDYNEVFDRISENYVMRNFDGVYYVPWNATTQLMIYNKELFREAGLDPENPPQTFDEFLEAAKKIDELPNREDGSDVYGTIFWNDALAWGGWYWTMLSQIYYNMNDGRYQLFNEYGTDIVFDQPDAHMVEFFDFIRSAQELAPPTMENNFFARNVGMWLQFGYGWKANLKEAQGEPMVIGEDVGVAPIPTPKEGDTHWSTLDGRALMIFKSNPEQEKIAWEFVKFLMRDEYNLAACKALGQLPTLKSLVNDPYFQRPEAKPFVDQLQNTLPNEPIAELDEVANIIQQVYVETVIEQKISSEEAVNKAAEKAREVLTK
ncbi:extracellular solute-binding protein [Vallitalea okinawensis]|uniref:extracellular solute-binding protein n=1 Tax=Vallitalea okinawensis TaxID=2078660 RepID=UPI000CFD1D94|nr:extracellular solute-binding protein [Vallitalea okinawensis]